jgi:hypothetical protein
MRGGQPAASSTANTFSPSRNSIWLGRFISDYSTIGLSSSREGSRGLMVPQAHPRGNLGVKLPRAIDYVTRVARRKVTSSSSVALDVI